MRRTKRNRCVRTVLEGRCNAVVGAGFLDCRRGFYADGVGLMLAAVGFSIMLTGRRPVIRRLGEAAAGIGLIVLASGLPRLGDWPLQIMFWLMATVAVAGAAAAVAARSPVYTAIWFAFSLLGVAGLFVIQQAQFLGVATIVVYAGAIIVTFLFVLMLAQPEGHASYDRLSWSSFAPPFAVLAATLLGAFVVIAVDSSSIAPQARGADLERDQQMARLGAAMYSQHLVAVEVAGTLLLVALVGAIAIVIHGRQRPQSVGAASSTPNRGAD